MSYVQDERVASVRVGNGLTIRTVFLCSLNTLCGCAWTIEQPVSSIVEHFPVMKRLLSLTGAARVSTWLGAFDAPSPKPIKLFTTSGWVHRLKRSKPKFGPGEASSLVVRRGHQITGVKQKLKASQTYPKAFGQAAARAKRAHGPLRFRDP